MAASDTPDIAQVFLAESRFAAQRIVDTLLHPEGISASIVDRTANREFPAVGQPGEVAVFVPVEEREKALAIIAEARQNGYLEPEDGEPSSNPA